jgi:transcriptional regulator with GAF, ATPase, and Fis domain
MIFDVVPADRGALLCFGDDSDQIAWSAAWDRRRGPGVPVRVSKTVAARVFREQSGLLMTNVSTNTELKKSASFAELPVHSLLCAPLVISGRVAGVIYLDTQDARVRFDANHLQMLTAIASLASLALDNIGYLEKLREENRELRTQITIQHNMVGSSARMREVFEFIRRVAPTDATVLIHGESGTGKELVAHAIHTNSKCANAPFVPINCAAISENLLESELFGYEKGAFTGAAAQKMGRLEAAAGGTVFFDEVGELAPSLQAKLLRALQEREIVRVGGTQHVKLDVRVIAATNRDLAAEVKKGAFREDLYHRLNVVALRTPPLRERPEDIPVLARHFLARSAEQCKRRVTGLSPEAERCLIEYSWPGNVRELENAMERAVVLGSTPEILIEDLPESILDAAALAEIPGAYQRSVIDAKRESIIAAYRQAGGDYKGAAKLLGVHPNYLLRLIRNLGLKEAVKQATG